MFCDNDGARGILTQVLAVLFGTLVAVSDGMHYGWTAPVIPILLGADSPLPITKSQSEWLETIVMIGAFCGLPITSYLVDKIGRKKSILLSTFVSLIIWIVIAVGNHFLYLLIARFFCGLVGDMAFVAAPMYIAEIADEKVRGFLAGLIYLMMLSGVVLIYCIAPFVPFYVPSIIASSFLLIELVVFPFMPDSPYYLLSTNKPDKARNALMTLRKTEDVDKELQDIAAAVKRQNTEQGRIQDLFVVPSNRKALIIMTILNGGQHLCCISVFLMNLHSILEAAGSIYLEPSISAIVFSLIMFVGAVIAMSIIDKYGRKVLLMSSSILTGLCLLSIAIYFTLQRNGVDVKGVSWLPIVAVMIYACTFKVGLGMVPIVMTAELFPSKMKAVGMTMSDSMYVIFAAVMLELYHFLVKEFGMHVPFYVFTVSCFFITVFTYFFIPETKGKTLEEIQFMLKGEPFPGKKVEENGKCEEF